MAPKEYWEVCARGLGMVDMGDKGGIRLVEGHELIEKSEEVVGRLFVAMGEEKRGVVGGKKEVDESGDDSDVILGEGEKQIEKADQEVEEILAHL
jgi:hypothetical protein